METALHNQTPQNSWLPVLILATSAFVFNTTEFAPVALLSDIAASFDMKVADTGLMITIYAWLVALTSLPLMLLTGKMERRNLLAIVFILFIIGHLISGIAWSFLILIFGRIIVAFAHAIFWSITASLAVRLAPSGKRMQALGLLATGTAIATVLGLPIGRVIGQMWNWRVTFLCIGAIAIVTLIGLFLYLPKLPSQDSGNLKSIPILLKKPALVGIFVVTVLIITAHFAAYSYIEPFAQNIAKMSDDFTTLLLLIFGGAGIIGSWIFSRFNAQHPKPFLIYAHIVVVLCLLTLLPMALHPSSFMALVLIWGVAITCIGLALQVKVLDLAPEATDVAMSIYSGIVNIGIGGGALLGNIIILQAGMKNIGFVSAFFALMALAVIVYLFKHYQTAFAPMDTVVPDDLA